MSHPGKRSKRALISVSDKTGLKDFAQNLLSLDFEIISTGGTAKALKEAGLAVRGVSDLTQFPEILGGRVKTLNPKILGGILARQDLERDLNDLKNHEIGAIDLVCVNLYPFRQTIAKGPVVLPEAIEKIDIGGPTMVRAAAKNHAHVLVVIDPDDYGRVYEALKEDRVDADLKFQLARKAFAHTASYDAAIAQYLYRFDDQDAANQAKGAKAFSDRLYFQFEKVQDLRYGENSHQKAAYYRDAQQSLPFKQLHGKELSFNNLWDMQGAWACVEEFSEPTCVIVKHTNPCGVARADNLLKAYDLAEACDPTSSFGGIVALNQMVNQDLAERLAEKFLEVILAPGFSPEALSRLQKKKNLRLIEVASVKDSCDSQANHWDFKRLSHGLLVQNWDRLALDWSEVRVVTKRQPTELEKKALKFAWSVVKHVKSNAIVLTDDQKTLGVGAGQMSRVDASKLAKMKALSATDGACLASDAFFPFRDGIDAAAQAGVRAVVQPGGSVRDDEVIAAADEHDLAMVFTGMRHFKH